jgi:hypothetical protein
VVGRLILDSHFRLGEPVSARVLGYK